MATFSAIRLGSRCERVVRPSRSKHGGHSVRVRSTLGPCITETPGSALTEPGPPNSASRSPTTEPACAMATCVEYEPGRQLLPGLSALLRFLGSTGEELFSESVPISLPPTTPICTSRRRPLPCEVTFDAFPGERIYGLGQHQHGCWTRRAPSSSLSSAIRRCAYFRAFEPRLWILLEHGRGGPRRVRHNRTRWVADGARQIDYW